MSNETSRINCISQKPKPFLRWAGGKSWLVKHFDTLFSNLRFNTYHEPFLGGGAMYFHLQPPKAILYDLNEKLIQTYQQVQSNVGNVIRELKKFENNEATYYQVRSTVFRSQTKKAAQFIYLNQTSYNGIYRENLNGVYNVPYGYREKEILDADNLRLASICLKSCQLFSGDFEMAIKRVKKNDLVFLDPPYTVTHNNNGFIKYNQKLFSLEDQYRLASLIEQIKSKDAKYILTNAAHHAIREIFSANNTTILELSRASLIGGKNASRGEYNELLITNIKHGIYKSNKSRSN